MGKHYKLIDYSVEKDKGGKNSILSPSCYYYLKKQVNIPKRLDEIINEVRKDSYDNIIFDILTITSMSRRRKDMNFDILALYKPGEILKSLK